jgi:hypothetical protein
MTVSTPVHGQRLVDVFLERDLLAAAQAFIGGQDDAAVATRHGRPALRAEPCEHDEWMAPMRAQASMATAASGTMGR